MSSLFEQLLTWAAPRGVSLDKIEADLRFLLARYKPATVEFHLVYAGMPAGLARAAVGAVARLGRIV